jgi:HTH-type transcriptional regulator/antitoxin HigA
MANEKDFKGNPLYAIPPGQTLLDTLEEIGMSQTELAKRMGRPVKTINEIIKGKAEITPNTAIELERALGVPSSLWNNLEKNYREKQALIKEKIKLEEKTGFLDKIPLSHMIREGWINKRDNKVDQLHEALSFYRISSVESWDTLWGEDLSKVAFRKAVAHKSDPWYLSTWLSKGELDAQEISCKPFDKSKFKQILHFEIRALTRISDPQVFLPRLVELCSNVGVAVVVIKELPKCAVNGATFWANSEKAVIQLSARYRSDDHLWFTFFHEAGHIVLHGKRDTFLEYGQNSMDTEEIEANNFSAETLIPHKYYEKFISSGQFSRTRILTFAEQIGISPGIVVGRLQHDELVPFRNLNDLKVRYTWSD